MPGESLISRELLPRVIDAAAAYLRTENNQQLQSVEDQFDLELKRVDGALVEVLREFEYIQLKLADAKADEQRWSFEAYVAAQRGSDELAIDNLERQQEAAEAVRTYERLLPELQRDVEDMYRARDVLRSGYRKLRQDVRALRARQAAAVGTGKMAEGLERLEAAKNALAEAQERIDLNWSEARGRLRVAREAPAVRRGYLERADLENRLAQLKDR